MSRGDLSNDDIQFRSISSKCTPLNNDNSVKQSLSYSTDITHSSCASESVYCWAPVKDVNSILDSPTCRAQRAPTSEYEDCTVTQACSSPGNYNKSQCIMSLPNYSSSNINLKDVLAE